VGAERGWSRREAQAADLPLGGPGICGAALVFASEAGAEVRWGSRGLNPLFLINLGSGSSSDFGYSHKFVYYLLSNCVCFGLSAK